MYWARPPQTAVGGERHAPLRVGPSLSAPGAVQRDFPISAVPGDTPIEPLGVLAVPGTYVVKLTAGGKTLTRSR